MKFTIDKSVLKKMIENIYPIVEKDSQLQLYKFIKICANSGSVSLSADNGHCYVETAAQTTTELDGVCGLSGKVLKQFVETLSDKPIQFERKDGVLVITCDRKVASLNIVDTDHFPVRWHPEFNSMSYYEIEGLVDAMKSVAFAATGDETRLVLQHIYVHQDKVVATDGHRLALVQLPKALENDFMIHKELLDKFGKRMSGKILMTRQDNKVLIINGDTRYVLTDTDKPYPNYSAVIPAKNPRSITFKTVDLKTVVKNITSMSAGEDFSKLIMEVKSTGCTISYSSHAFGNITENLDCIAATGGDVRISFRAKYLLDALRLIKEENVTLAFQNPLSPVIIIEKNLTQVVMPLRI